MNLDNKEDLWLIDQLNKCRCCFEKFDHSEKKVKITEIIKQQFLELTQIELKSSSIYSNNVCMKCTNELQSISNFRLNLILKQQQLYEFVTTSQYKTQDAVKFELVNIKIETQSSDEFENIFKFETQYEEIEKTEVPVKSEATKANDQQLATNSYSMNHRKPNELKVNTKGQKKLLNKVKKIKATTTTCPHCGIMLISSHSLSRHIRRVHLKERNFFCDLCEYGSTFKSGIVKHMPTHVPLEFRENLSCEQCEFVTILDQEMKSHVRDYHSTKSKNILVCHCGERFIKKSLLNKHIKCTHDEEKDHICTVCEKFFSNSKNLKIHMQIHTNQSQVKTIVKKKSSLCMCPHCGIMLLNDTLPKHIRRLHLKERNFFCDLCEYSSISKYHIVQHMKTHVSLIFRRKMHCSKCDFVTISDQGMRSHVKSDRCKEIKKKVEIVCYCGKVFYSKEGFNYHIKYTHQQQKNHICTICEKGFPFLNQLKKHMDKHNRKFRKRDIACEVCGKLFVTMRNLREHSARHKDPRFVCSFEGCTKKFFKPNVLESHKKTHTDQRDFACQLCDNKYFASYILKRHILKFHKQLEVNCELSGSTS